MILHIAILIVLSVILCHIYLRLTLKRCESNVFMGGKVVIVTGANAGIGYKIAEGLAGRGARVILACRNEERGTSARDKIISETGNNDVVFKKLDLASLSSVRKFCEDINKTESRLDVLINNAGMFGSIDRYTEDGIIESMQVNHYGPFLLTLLLLPLLKKSKPSRIVNVSSMGHLNGKLELENVTKEGTYLNEGKSYFNSKLFNVIFTVELARRLRGTGVVANAVHPGMVYTELMDDTSNRIGSISYKIYSWICYRTAFEAAQTPIYVSIAKECETVSGKYFVDCKQWPTKKIAQNKDAGLKLWEYSEKLVNYKMEDI